MIYICSMIQIDKFKREEFGSLTTITNSETGVTMFIGKEVAEMWGHTNLTQAVQRLLDQSEQLLVTKKDYPSFFKIPHLNEMLKGRTARLLLISESGLYKLSLASNLETAKPFRDWVTKEVLPNIRKHGSYNLRLSQSELFNQTKREVQLDNSKKVNAKNYEKNGKDSTIKYNQANCKQVTGLEPNQIKEMFNAKKYKSAKQVLREKKPELAATMSLNDHLIINNNVELEQLKEIDKAFIPAFKELIKAGFEITE